MKALYGRVTWRSCLAVTALLFALVLLMPALMPQETALEISLAGERGSLPDGFYIYQSLNERGIKIKSITPSKDSLVVMLDSSEQALAAQSALQELLPDDYAISRAPESPRWRWLKYWQNHSTSVG